MAFLQPWIHRLPPAMRTVGVSAVSSIHDCYLRRHPAERGRLERGAPHVHIAEIGADGLCMQVMDTESASRNNFSFKSSQRYLQTMQRHVAPLRVAVYVESMSHSHMV